MRGQCVVDHVSVRLIDRQLGVTIWQGSCNNNKKKKQNLELK